jgi:hypothetical protein
LLSSLLAARYTGLMTILPFIGDTYGDSGAWCWIDNSDTGKVWRFMAFYVPVPPLFLLFSLSLHGFLRAGASPILKGSPETRGPVHAGSGPSSPRD